MNSLDNIINIHHIISIAQEAGRKILQVYHKPGISSKKVEKKADDSPLTLADKVSHQYIVKELSERYSHIPILSEEGREIAYEIRKKWDFFWLVDPLDGTKEFINRNGDFTVNIAFIFKNNPVFGVINAPERSLTYYGGKDIGAFKAFRDKDFEKITVNSNKDNLVGVRSRSHASMEEELFYTGLVSHYISVGSSLKFCMVADGQADLYYRFGPTMEWDTAAGQAIVEAAGGSVVETNKCNSLVYNKPALRNTGFICKANY